MIKYPILLIILLIIPFFIIPVNAQIINGDFEDGLNGWTYTSNEISVVNYEGSNRLRINGSTSGDYITLWQTVDLTNYDIFEGYGKQFGTNLIRVLVNQMGGFTEDYLSMSYPTDTWNYDSVDVSAYTGNHIIEINVKRRTDSYIYLDDLRFINTSICSINYNPDIPVSNVKPFNLSYTLNTTYADNPLYPCFIYSYRGTDISSNDTPHIIWLSSYEGYVNLATGNFVTSNYFHHYDWTELNRSYGVVLYNPNDRTSGYINFDTIENDPNFLAKDQIYVHYNYSYPTPTPQPTPNMTELPTPTGSPTPGPSATPQPDPESINESLNTSFKQGYSNLVNTTIDGFYEPVYNFTYYIASPLLGINDTLYNFSTHMNESFTNSSSSLILSSSILFLIMTNIPDKLINVMTYYLIWLIVLLIFKGDA